MVYPACSLHLCSEGLTVTSVSRHLFCLLLFSIAGNVISHVFPLPPLSPTNSFVTVRFVLQTTLPIHLISARCNTKCPSVIYFYVQWKCCRNCCADCRLKRNSIWHRKNVFMKLVSNYYRNTRKFFHRRPWSRSLHIKPIRTIFSSILVFTSRTLKKKKKSPAFCGTGLIFPLYMLN